MTPQTHPSHVPLSQLIADDAVNARRTNIGPDPALIASIRIKGITTALTVRPKGENYAITDGRRRFLAMKQLVDGGFMPADVSVPILVREESDAEAHDTSLTTLIIRAPAHPVDRFEAFAELVKGGMSDADIAARYAMSEKEVSQSLALGALSPKIREAWRAGELDAKAAMAFTLANSLKEQDLVFSRLSKDRGLDAYSVRQQLAGKERDLGKLIAFVGIDELRKAGVKVAEDLFGTDHRATDPKQVAAMSAEKLQAECQKLIDAGWAWALPSDDPEVKERAYMWQSLPHRDSKPTPAEKKRLDELKALTDKDWNGDDGEDDPWDLIGELEEAIRARAYKPAEKAKAGCILSIGDKGDLKIQWGKLKPAAARQVKKEEKQAERKKKGLPENAGPELTNAVAHDLSVALTRAAASAIAHEPDLALQFALVGLLTSGYGGSGICLKNDGLGGRNMTRDMEFEEAVAAVAAMKPAARMTLLAEQVGASFSFLTHNANGSPLQNKDDDGFIVCNAINAKAMNAALRETFDAADYFKRVPAALVVKAIEEAVNPEEARRVGKLKKKDAVDFAIANVIGTGWLPDELRVAGYDGPGAKTYDKNTRAKALGPAKGAEKKSAKAAKKPGKVKRS